MKQLKNLFAVGVASLLAVSAHGTLVVPSSGDTFDGDGVGDFAGPFGGYLIETTGIAPDGVVNTTAAGLGINALSADTADRFDPGQAWTFRFPGTAIEFQGIDLGDFDSTEQFTLSSTAWIGRSYTPTESEISFSPATGAFIFGAGTISDDFDLNDLTGGAAIWTPANANLVLTYSAGSGDGVLEDFTFSAVPEPSTVMLIGVGGWLMTWFRRRQK